MSLDLDSLSKAVGDQVTSIPSQVLVVHRSANEQEANAKKIEVDTDIARENLWKIRLHRRLQGGIPGFIIGIIVGALASFLIFYKK